MDLNKAQACFHVASKMGNVHGYVGLSRVAHRRGEFAGAMKFRITAFVKAMRILNDHPDGSDEITRW